jgi:hypothetical protein
VIAHIINMVAKNNQSCKCGRGGMMNKTLKEKAYKYGNSSFPIDTFYNDIRDNKSPTYDKESAFNGLEKIIDVFIQKDQQIAQLKKELEALQRKEEWLIVKTTWAKPKYAVCKSEQVVSLLHSDFTPQINTSFYFIVDKFKTKEEAIKKLNEMKGE